MGPLDSAVAAVVRAALAAELPGAAHLRDDDVERCTKAALGDVRVDLRRVFGAERIPRDACERARRRLEDVPGVTKAVAVPPRLYLALDVRFVYDAVVDGVGAQGAAYGAGRPRGMRAIVQFSDPNVNKPLHVGHLRNNFLGMAMSGLLEIDGYTVERQADHNDWTLPACQAAVAYRLWGDGATPASTGLKGDHLVGRYYVMFHQRNAELRAAAADDATELDDRAVEMLVRMERGDAEAVALNEVITGWADEGIRATYGRIGTDVDVYYESHLVDEGRAIVAEGLERGAFRRRADGSVYCDLTDAGFGEITIVRRDGTPTVYRQWLAIDIHRFMAPSYDRAVILIGQEWKPGFTLFLEMLRRLGHDWMSRLEIVYYGMVAQPEGRMKSRYGAVVTVDGLLDELESGLRDRGVDAGRAPALATGVLKHMLLAVRRDKDVTYDDGKLWSEHLPRFEEVVETLEWAEDPSAAAPSEPAPRDAGDESALRALLLAVDEWPRAAAQACTRLDPARVVRFVEELVSSARRCERRVGVPLPLRRCTAITLRRALGTINVDVPSVTASPPVAR